MLDDFPTHLKLFRPSDRHALAIALSDPNQRDVALNAIKDFIIVWENASWLDENSIERLGRWIGKYQSKDIIDDLQEWAQSSFTVSRRTLVNGMEKGLVGTLA